MSTSPTRRGRRVLTAIASIGAVAAITLVLAGCGSGSSNGSSSASTGSGPYGGSSSSSGSATTNSSGGSSVDLASTSLGKVLVDSSGRTLYLFEADKGPKSMCDGACAAAWPPLTTKGNPKAGAGVSAAKLGTTKRSDGSTEITYNGHPLYTFAGDTAKGQTNGQGIDGFGAEWYVLSAAGSKID
jgi:predicted lipoprotein with Yx(FWY)xxD motif